MKNNFEDNQLLFTCIFIFLVIEIITILIISNGSIRSFYKINGIIITNNYVKIYINNRNLQKLKHYKYLYVDNKRKKYEISNIERNVLKSKNTWYHEVLLELKTSKKYQENDSILLTIYDNRKSLFSIFKSCWKE